jgi:hypothetical protein
MGIRRACLPKHRHVAIINGATVQNGYAWGAAQQGKGRYKLREMMDREEEGHM